MYLESYNSEAKTTVKSHIDFAIFGENKEQMIMCSLCDIGVNVRGVMANFNSISEQNYGKLAYISLKKYLDSDYFCALSNVVRYSANTSPKWQYKICKDNKYTHGIVYNKELIANTIIDYSGNNKYKLIGKYLNDKANIPITDEIVELLDKEIDFKELDVYSTTDTTIKAYYISDYTINSISSYLKRIELPLKNTEEEMLIWNDINTVNDYVLTFNKAIRKRMNDNIDIRFNNKDEVDMRMFDYPRKPYKGQVPLIQAGIKTLQDEQRVVYTCQMGTGKTTIGTMCNDLYMKSKNKSSYMTLIVAPNSTLKKWRDEIYKTIRDNIHVEICESTNQFIKFIKSTKIDKPTYIITSKETAKLGFKRYPAIQTSARIIKYKNSEGFTQKQLIKDLAICPHCGMPMKNVAKNKKDEINNEYLTINDFKSIKKSNYKCPNCNEVLWSAMYKKTVKTSLMDYCHRKHIIFDSLIWDEFHNEKNISSATGSTFGNIIKMSKNIILLSGTMNNGNVSSLFPLLMRLIPRKMFKDGYTMKDMDKFINSYGSLKAIKTIKDDEQRATNRTMFKDSDFSEIAGVNPIVFTKYLSDICISATMDDLGIKMVKYTEFPVEVEIEKSLAEKYNSLSRSLKSIIPYNFEMYNSSVVRHYINNPFNWTQMTVKKPTRDGFDLQTIHFSNMNPKTTLNKEDMLLDLIEEKLSENKKCIVFTDFTGGNSKYQQGEVINDRLNRILTEQGIKSKELKANIKPIDRMDYINKYPETQVWITNPILVREGLDLIDYPIIIFYNFDYEPMKIQQASRRAWRSIQTVDCETYYFYYKDSIEEKIMKSITLKKMEMNSIEGKYDIDSFNLVKRTASALGKELYDCINIKDEFNKSNNIFNIQNVELNDKVENLYNN